MESSSEKEINSSNDKGHFCAFIRHGEKGNKVKGFKFKNKHDPPLTPLGI